MQSVQHQRDVTAANATFSIVGHTHDTAPILAHANTVHQVKDDVNFAPGAGRLHVVRSTLGSEHSALWIEDDRAKAVIGDKIEVKDDSSLGCMEK